MVVWVGGLAGLGNHDYILIYIDIDSSKLMMFLMFARAFNHFVWCFGTSKADFFDLGLMEASFFMFALLFFGIKNAKKTLSHITSPRS